MKQNRYSILLFATAVLILLGSTLSSYFPVLKYLKYSSLVLMLPVVLKQGISKRPENYTAPFLILFLYTLLRIDIFTLYSLYHLIFWFAALLPFLTRYSTKIKLKSLNIICFIAPLIYLFNNNVDLDFSINAFLRSNTSSLEGDFNVLTFIYSLFFVYWLLRKNKLMAFLNLIFVLITFKRIAFLVIPISILLSILPNKFFIKKKTQYIMVIANCLYLILTYKLASGQFNSVIENYTGISAGFFTMGRTSMYELIISQIKSSSLLEYLFGHGTGSTTFFLVQNNSHMLHNDVLKIFFETGAIIFLLFFYQLYKIRTKEQFILVVSLNIFFLTDNTLIYTPVLLFYFILMNQFVIREKHSV